MTPRWLKLKQAAKHTAMNEKRLIALAQAGEVRGFRDTDTKRGHWIFDRLSLDAYREAQDPDPELQYKFLDLCQRAGI